jgi:hypothetical protein
MTSPLATEPAVAHRSWVFQYTRSRRKLSSS